MTPETQRKIDCTMIALRILRQHGVIPCDAPATPALMAFVSETIGERVSKATFRRVQQSAIASARRTLNSPIPAVLTLKTSNETI